VKSKGRHYIPGLNGAFFSESEIRARARENFLWAITIMTPAPLYSLRDDVLPAFQAAFELEAGRGKSSNEIKELSAIALLDVTFPHENADLRALPEYQAFRDSSLLIYRAIEELMAWTRRFNLEGRRAKLSPNASPEAVGLARMDSVWPLVVALETILGWHFLAGRAIETLGGIPIFRSWNPPVKPMDNLEPIQLRTVVHDTRASIPREMLDRLVPDGPPIEPPKEVNTPAWQVEWEPEGSFRARALKDFQTWLNGYVADRKRSAQSTGLVKGPGKRDLSHFVWAAKCQVERVPLPQLANKYNVSPETMVDGVRSILNLIRLSRRPSLRGPKSEGPGR
jgi:hypothetical protein